MLITTLSYKTTAYNTLNKNDTGVNIGQILKVFEQAKRQSHLHRGYISRMMGKGHAIIFSI